MLSSSRTFVLIHTRDHADSSCAAQDLLHSLGTHISGVTFAGGSVMAMQVTRPASPTAHLGPYTLNSPRSGFKAAQ